MYVSQGQSLTYSYGIDLSHCFAFDPLPTSSWSDVGETVCCGCGIRFVKSVRMTISTINDQCVWWWLVITLMKATGFKMYFGNQGGLMTCEGSTQEGTSLLVYYRPNHPRPRKTRMSHARTPHYPQIFLPIHARYVRKDLWNHVVRSCSTKFTFFIEENISYSGILTHSY